MRDAAKLREKLLGWMKRSSPNNPEKYKEPRKLCFVHCGYYDERCECHNTIMNDALAALTKESLERLNKK